MNYQHAFESAVDAALGHARFDAPAREQLWPEAMTQEGVAYGQSEDLAAEEAASYYLAAAALLRMCDGDLGVPLATRIIHGSRKLARERDLSPGLQDVLERMDEERREWIMANHEFQGADLRLLRPVPSEGPQVDDYAPSPDWPDILDRLLGGTPAPQD